MDNLLQIGIVLTAIDKMSGVLTGAAEKATQGFARLQQKIKAVSATMTEMGTKATLMGHGIISALETPVKAFADLDEASTNLRVAMMDNLGQIPPQFAEINRQAVELGNLLPGTTADFVNSARALIENGTALDTIVGGGLKAASYLGVILKLPQAGAAEMVAKFREAFGLTENELVKMADLTQRAKFAFGLAPDEIQYAAEYAGSTLNNLKLTGIANTQMFLAMQGIARQKNMSGSVFGTNFASMLNNIGMMESKLGRNSKIMKEVNGDLRRAGIHMQFFDKAGKFVGLEKMVGELEKLKVLSEKDMLNVLNRVFGMEGGRVVSMLSQAGVTGLHDYMGRMEHQADLMKRIDEITKSAKNTWEALTGTITNFWAAVGEPMVTSLYPLINKVNEFVGGPLMDWVAEHKELVKWLGLGTAALGVLLVALGGLGIVAGAVGTGLSVLCGLFAALTWPVTLTIAALVGGAILIIKYWDQVKAFFVGYWQGFMVGIQPIIPQLRKLWQQIKWVCEIILDIIGHVDVSTGKIQSFGAAIGYVVGRIYTYVGVMIQCITLPARMVIAFVQAAHSMYQAGGNFIDMLLAGMQAAGGKITEFVQSIIAQLRAVFGNLVHEFFAFGAAMLDMLVAGIKSKVGAVVGTVSSLTERVRGFFNHSPAKEGALKDIHQHTLSEMVASAIRPEPVVRALQAMTAAGLMALTPLTNPVVAMAAATPPAMAGTVSGLTSLPSAAAPAMPAPAVMPALPPLSLPLPPAPKPAPRLAPSAASQSGAAAPVTVHFAPQITVQGGAGTAKDDIMAALKKHEHELVKLIEQVMARNARRQY